MEYEFEKDIFEKNECVIRGVHIKPCGVMVHSTGCNNPNLSRYIPKWNTYHGGGRDIGPHPFVRDPSRKGFYCKTCGGRQVCVHGFIGRRADGSVGFTQTAPWNIRTWHSGRGVNGSANNLGYIGFEICEDNLEDAEYFEAAYSEAVKLTAYLCQMYNFDPLAPGVVVCHSEGHEMGIASNHADVMHWFPKFGKSMDTFREDVAKMLADPTAVRYNRFEEIPNWAQPAVDKLIQAGRLTGFGSTPRDENGRPTDMDLSLDMVRILVMLGGD